MGEVAERAYGPHLTVDAYGCGREALASLEAVHGFLDRMPGVIGMEKITKPYAFRHLAPPDPEWGITGVVIIATSHISFHSYPQLGMAFIDVFSCRAFDEEKALEFVGEMFHPARMDTNTTRRGKDFAKEMERARNGEGS